MVQKLLLKVAGFCCKEFFIFHGKSYLCFQKAKIVTVCVSESGDSPDLVIKDVSPFDLRNQKMTARLPVFPSGQAQFSTYAKR